MSPGVCLGSWSSEGVSSPELELQMTWTVLSCAPRFAVLISTRVALVVWLW